MTNLKSLCIPGQREVRNDPALDVFEFFIGKGLAYVMDDERDNEHIAGQDASAYAESGAVGAAIAILTGCSYHGWYQRSVYGKCRTVDLQCSRHCQSRSVHPKCLPTVPSNLPRHRDKLVIVSYE